MLPLRRFLRLPRDRRTFSSGWNLSYSFGDNLNDISLFEACDECYAVSNAKDEVIRRADGVIGANTADSVVIFIAERENITL